MGTGGVHELARRYSWTDCQPEKCRSIIKTTLEIIWQYAINAWKLARSRCRTSGSPEIRKIGYPDFRDIRISGNPEIRESGNPDFRKSGNPDFRISGYPDFRKSRYPKIWKSANPQIPFESSQNQKLKNLEIHQSAGVGGNERRPSTL